MTRLLGVLFLVILVVSGIGYYRGWFSVSKTSEGINVTMDKQKLQEDEAAAKKKLEDAAKAIKDK